MPTVVHATDRLPSSPDHSAIAMAARLVLVLGAFQLFSVAACTRSELKQTETGPLVAVESDTIYARQLFERATQYLEKARYDSAMAYFESASTYYKEVGDWEQVVYCETGKGDCVLNIGQFGEAEKLLYGALDLGIEHLGEFHPAVGEVFSTLGWLRMREGDYDLAFEAHGKALLIRTAAFGYQHDTVADSYNRLALVHYLAGDYDRAETHYKEALHIRLTLSDDDHQQTGAIYTNLGLLYRDEGHYDRAVDYFERALAITRSSSGNNHLTVARTLRNLGETYRLQGNYERAFEAHDSALNIAKAIHGEIHRDVADILNDLAIVHSNIGNPEKAIPYYKRSLSIIEGIMGSQHHEVATRLSGLGVAYLEIGDYDLSLRYLHSALRIRRSKFGDKDRVVGIYLNNIGSLYSRKGEYELARDYYEKSVDAFHNSLSELHPYIANQYKKLGGIMNRLGAQKDALAYLEKALRIFRATSGEQDPYVATVYGTLASVYDSLGATTRALAFHRKALRHVISAQGAYHPAVAFRHNEIADLYRRSGAHDFALAHYDKALNANRPNISELQPAQHGQVVSFSDSYMLMSLWGKARALAARAAAHESGVQDQPQALDAYFQAAQTLDRMHRRYRSQDDHLHWVDVAAPLMSDAVDVSFALYEATGHERYKSAAFYFAEKSKGSVLLGALSEARARRFAGIPDSLLSQERSLLASLVTTEQRLLNLRTGSDASTSTELERLEQEAFTFTQQHAALIEHIETTYPNYYKLKYNVEVVTPERLQTSGLDEETALVEYMIGDKDVFIFTVSATDFDITAVPRSPKLEQQVAELRRGIVEQNYETYTANARALYVQLLEPVIHTIHARNLLIVPDGILNYVPFESLLTEAPTRSSDNDYSRLPYLITRYAVSYSYSSTLLIETRSRERLEPDRDFVAFAPVAADGLLAGSAGADLLQKYALAGSAHPAKWGYLPMTRVEVKQIKALFTRTYSFIERLFPKRARVYLGDDARESQLMSDDISRYRYVHFATHGFADPSSPESSGIVLFSTPQAAAADDSTLLHDADPSWSEDGVLRLDEVYALRLNADVVVLSACETGVGPVARGEGILSLARGFLYAGASNVVASLWKADDLQTQRLMLGFYENMLGGSATSSSLRSAKLDLIRESSRYARPYYWATFVLIGA